MPHPLIRTLMATLALSALLVPSSAGAWVKLGSAGGKVAAVGKGAAAGGAAVAGAEMATGANAIAKVGAVGGSAEGATAAGAQSADELSKAFGLGKAVPDDMAAMLTTPGKTLADVPDTGARAGLATPLSKLKASNADLLVTDYVKLLQGKPAIGPANRPVTAGQAASKKTPEMLISGHTLSAQVPWHAIEVLARAAHLGHRAAQNELSRLCQGTDQSAQRPAQCAATPTPTTSVARKT